MILRMGEVEMEFEGPYLGELRDANDILDDVDALRARMAEDGYLLIRGLHDRADVVAARKVFLNKLSETAQLAEGRGIDEAVIRTGSNGAFWGGRREVTHDEAVLRVIEGEPVMRFFAGFLGGDVVTYDYKWIRVVGRPQFTGAHYDVVYMGRGTKDVYTCWTPFSDIGFENGPLAICVGSHRFDKVKETYGTMDVDRDRVDGWFSSDPREIVEKFGGRWMTTSFGMGDAIIFGMFTMHGSLNNESDRFRISSDTRYQLASEPIDERWIGENPPAHYAWHSEPDKRVTMEEARAKWKV